MAFATGALCWPPSEALSADVNLVLIAREGQHERDHDLYTTIFAAQGIKLPPLHPPEKPKLTAQDFKGWAAANNAAHRAKAKAPKPGQLKVAKPKG